MLNLLDLAYRLHDRLRSRKGRKRWAAAQTLPDLCHLTGAWLQGDLDTLPCGDYGPCETEDDNLIDTLAALCRRGVLVDVCSFQKGFQGLGRDSRQWKLLAAFTGYADNNTVAWLRETLTGTRFEMLVHPCQHWFRRLTADGTPVTWVDGDTNTTFGRQRTPRDIRLDYDACPPEAIDTLCAVWQVTVCDPRVGSNDLWPTLLHACQTGTPHTP